MGFLDIFKVNKLPEKIKLSVIGATGSGKTALLYSICEELQHWSDSNAYPDFHFNPDPKSISKEKPVLKIGDNKTGGIPAVVNDENVFPKTLLNFMQKCQEEFSKNRFRPTDDTESYLGEFTIGKIKIPIEILNLSGKYFNIDLQRRGLTFEQLTEFLDNNISDSTAIIISLPIESKEENNKYKYIINGEIQDSAQSLFNYYTIIGERAKIPKIRVITKFDVFLKSELSTLKVIPLSEKYTNFLKSPKSIIHKSEKPDVHHFHNYECLRCANDLWESSQVNLNLSVRIPGDIIVSKDKNFRTGLFISGINILDEGLVWNGGQRTNTNNKTDDSQPLQTLNYFPGVRNIVEWFLLHSNLIKENQLALGYEDNDFITKEDYIALIKASK